MYSTDTNHPNEDFILNSLQCLPTLSNSSPFDLNITPSIDSVPTYSTSSLRERSNSLSSRSNNKRKLKGSSTTPQSSNKKSNVTSSDKTRTLSDLEISPFAFSENNLCSKHPTIVDLCSNLKVFIFTFLEHHDVAICGLVCRDFYRISCDPILWTTIDFSPLPIKFQFNHLIHMIGRCNDLHSLQKVRLICNNNDELNPVVDECTERFNEGVFDTKPTCTPCTTLAESVNRFSKLQTLSLHHNTWISSCAIYRLLSSTNQLRTIDITQTLNVNSLVYHVAHCCPQLVHFHFSYERFLEHNSIEHPVLNADMALLLANNCTQLQDIQFTHHAVDENSAVNLLTCASLIHVNLSDNDNLHGFFMNTITPSSSLSLKTLTLRDCTELNSEPFINCLDLILLDGWYQLEVIDVSCQWSFVNESILHDQYDSYMTKLVQANKRHRDKLRDGHNCTDFVWREDQCLIPGFGVDPEDGIDFVMDVDGGQEQVDDGAPDFDFTFI